jgi:hypothetical protein
MKKLGFSLLSVLLFVSLSVAKDKAAGAKATSMSGYITDAACAAKGGAAVSDSDCAKKCAEKGEKLVFVGDKDKKVYQVDNQDALKGHEGHHVRVTGKDDNGTLHVDKVSMLKSSGENKKAGGI